MGLDGSITSNWNVQLYVWGIFHRQTEGGVHDHALTVWFTIHFVPLPALRPVAGVDRGYYLSITAQAVWAEGY